MNCAANADQLPQPRGRRRFVVTKVTVVLGGAVTVATGIGLISIGMLFFVRDVFGASSATTSMFGSTWTGVYSLACIVFAPLSRRIAPRHSLVIATVGMAAALSVLVTVDSLSVAFVLYGAYGASIAFFWPATMGWLSQGLEHRELSRIISWYNLSWSTGTIIGPFLGGALFELRPLLPIYTGIGLFALAAVGISLAAWLAPAVRNERPGNSAAPTARGRIGADVGGEVAGGTPGNAPVGGARGGAAAASTAVGTVGATAGGAATGMGTVLRFPAWVSLFSLYFGFGVVANVLPLYLRERIGLTESMTGLMLLVRAVASTAMFPWLGRTMFWHHRPAWLVASAWAVPAIGALLMMVTLATGSAAAATAAAAIAGVMLLYGAVLAVTYNNSVFHGSSGAANRAARMAVHESVLTGGIVAGSVAGGLVYQTYSITAAFSVVVALAVGAAAAATGLVLGVKREKSR